MSARRELKDDERFAIGPAPDHKQFPIKRRRISPTTGCVAAPELVDRLGEVTDG
jgi:hypothetical protein